MSQAYSTVLRSTQVQNQTLSNYGKADVLNFSTPNNLRNEEKWIDFLRSINFLTIAEHAYLFHLIGFQKKGLSLYKKHATVAEHLGFSKRAIENAVAKLKQYGFLREGPRKRKSKEFFIRPFQQWHFLLPFVDSKVKHFKKGKKPCPHMEMFTKLNEGAEKNLELIIDFKEDIEAIKKSKKKAVYSEPHFYPPEPNGKPKTSAQTGGQKCGAGGQKCGAIRNKILKNTNTNTNNNIREKFCLEDVIEGKGGLKVDRKGVKFVSLINREITRCGEEGLKKILEVYGEGFGEVDDEGIEGIEGIRSFCFAYVMAYHLKAFRGVKFAFVSKTDRDALRRTSMTPGMSLNDFQKQMPFFCQNSWGYAHGFTTYSSNRMRMRRASRSFGSLSVDTVSIVPVVSSVVSVVKRQEVKIVNNTKRVAADALPPISGERKTEILVKVKDREDRKDTVVASAPVVQKLETTIEQKMTPEDVLRACWVKARVYYVMLGDRTLEDTKDLPDNVLAFFEARGCAPCKTRVEFFKTFSITQTLAALGEPLTAKAS
jgi:hypothetical protein